MNNLFFIIKKHQVARLGFFQFIHWFTGLCLLPGIPWQIDSQQLKINLDKTTATHTQGGSAAP